MARKKRRLPPEKANELLLDLWHTVREDVKDRYRRRKLSAGQIDAHATDILRDVIDNVWGWDNYEQIAIRHFYRD